MDNKCKTSKQNILFMQNVERNSSKCRMNHLGIKGVEFTFSIPELICFYICRYKNLHKPLPHALN